MTEYETAGVVVPPPIPPWTASIVSLPELTSLSISPLSEKRPQTGGNTPGWNGPAAISPSPMSSFFFLLISSFTFYKICSSLLIFCSRMNKFNRHNVSFSIYYNIAAGIIIGVRLSIIKRHLESIL